MTSLNNDIKFLYSQYCPSSMRALYTHPHIGQHRMSCSTTPVICVCLPCGHLRACWMRASSCMHLHYAALCVHVCLCNRTVSTAKLIFPRQLIQYNVIVNCLLRGSCSLLTMKSNGETEKSLLYTIADTAIMKV